MQPAGKFSCPALRPFSWFILLFALVTAGSQLHATTSSVSGTSFTGSFAADDDQRIFYLTVANSGILTARTWSYAGGVDAAAATIPAGGFDPTLSLFDASGRLIAYNRDGGCPAVGADPVTGFCWDSLLSVSLPAGNYALVLTQSENLPNGPTLADLFAYAGQPSFTAVTGVSTSGFEDQAFSQRTSAYALDISGATVAVTAITSSSTLPGGTVGQAYGPFTFAAQSGPGAQLVWSIAAGSLPAGLTLSSAGVLSGTPTTSGSSSLTVQVTDGIQPVTQAVTLAIAPASTGGGSPGGGGGGGGSKFGPFVTTVNLPGGVTGVQYGPANLLASGGSGHYTFTGSGFAPGLAVAPNGEISGTPLTAGKYTPQVTVTDSTTGLTGSASLVLLVTLGQLQISSAAGLGEFTPASAISTVLTGTGGEAPYRWSASGLPSGFSLGITNGLLAGIAGTPGNYGFSAQLTDSEATPVTVSGSISWSVFGITTTSLAAASTTSVYSAAISAVGGKPPYRFTATGLPAGLTLSTAGALTGTPAAVGSFAFVAQVSDSAGFSNGIPLTLLVTGPASPLTVSGGTLPAGTASNGYSTTLQATGGTPPYTWSVTNGATPAGLTLNSSGTLSGSPKSPGNSTFTAQATDSTGASASGTYSLTVTAPPLMLTSTAFPNGIVGAVYPAQQLAATGGLAPYTFSIGGSLPAGMALNGSVVSGTPAASGSSRFSLSVNDSSGQSASAQVFIFVQPNTSDIILLSQSAVSLALTQGSNADPPSAAVTLRSSNVADILTYSTSVTPSVAWLSAVGAGSTPGVVTISATSAALSLAPSATPYSATVNVTSGSFTQSIAISLTVSAPPQQLSAPAGPLSFPALTPSSPPAVQTFAFSNTGGGTLDIQSVTGSAAWLSISPAPALLDPGLAASLTLTANPAGLSPGSYLADVTIQTSAGSATVPVTLLVSPNPQITLGPSGITITPGVANGSFAVIASGSVSWTAAVVPGASWLSIANTTANSVGWSIDPNAVAGLTPGTYYGAIEVTAPDAADSPVDFEVVLNVPTAQSLPVPVLGTGGLVFTAAGSQTVSILSSSGSSVPWQSSAATTDGAAWLTVSPATGTAPGQSTVSVNTANLVPGIYTGSVSYAFSGDAVRSVNVTLLVTSYLAPATSATPNAKASCAPSRLSVTQTGLVGNFLDYAGWPAPVAVSVTDDCGNPVSSAYVSAAFSNGDPPLPLTPVDNVSGVYVGTWTPLGVSSQVLVTTAAVAAGLASGSASVTGAVRDNNAPTLANGGTLNVFYVNVGAALAPGTIVQIYGSNMATGIFEPSAVPLPTQLAGTSVLIGGIAAPLFYVSPGQINAEVPFELAAGSQYQVQINNNGALSTPIPIQIAPAMPDIAVYPSGEAVAQHTDGSYVTDASPAAPGSVITLYLAGMGATHTPVADGAGSPYTPLAHPVVTPTLNLNGSPVTIDFAGLAPGSVALYQINFTVPAGTPNGLATLVVTQGGSSSNTVLLPVHN